MTKITLEGFVHPERADGGCSLIADDFYDDPECAGGLFVRLQSWDPDKKHPRMMELVRKKVRITIEVVE